MTVTTEETDSAQEANGQPRSSNASAANETKQLERSVYEAYSMPGVLHYIQHEWTRFELERSQWEFEKAELEAKIAFLQGERKGQENLKNDLVRRIKMLEYALRQERVKFHKLKYGTDVPSTDMNKCPVKEEVEDSADSDQLISSSSNLSWRQGRQLLRQYLHEIGYTEAVIDVRSNRVRTLLGLKDYQEANTAAPVPDASNMKTEFFGKANMTNKTNVLAEDMLKDAEKAVMSNFDFLNDGGVDVDDTDDEDDLSSEEINVKQNKNANDDDELDSNSMTRVLQSLDLNFTNMNNIGAMADWDSSGQNSERIEQQKAQGLHGPASVHFNMGGSGSSLENVGLGELAQLSVSNETDSCYQTNNKEPFSKVWNAKYTMRSHFDGIRSLVFHPIEPVLVTASEDHTMKLWNLSRTLPAKKSVFLDVEPIYTFRGHVGAVLCVGMNPTGEQCYSGGQDGTVRVWNLPNSNMDPYDSYDPVVLHQTLSGHTDAVWGLALHTHKTQFLSCSADGTIKLWSPGSKVPLLHTYTSKEEMGSPTSVDFIHEDCSQMVVAYTSGKAVVYDLETANQIVMLDSDQSSKNTVVCLPEGDQINCIVSHPTLALAVAAHEDRCIRFYDILTGKVVHGMAAHQDAVTTLAIDPNGLYLLSGSHDCSIRMWNLESKLCVQEITSHRKKCDEGIHSVAFHPSKPLIASAGADAVAKVFV